MTRCIHYNTCCYSLSQTYRMSVYCQVSINTDLHSGLKYCFNYYYLRNKSWKTECVGSFNMDWRIKSTNIRQSMLKLKAHSGFHDLF